MTMLVSAEAVVTGRGKQGDSLLIDGSQIVAVGDRRQLLDTATTEVTFNGATIAAGFRDAHIHAVPYAALLRGCSLKGAADIPDLLGRITRHLATLPPDQPFVATRFDDETLAERRLPTRADLDRVVEDRPAVIYRYCGHIAVANTRALEASGIDEGTADPEGGSIDRDASGTPTGVLRETAAGLIASALARGGLVSEDQLLNALTGLASLGITSIGAMIGYGEAPSEKLAAEVDLWRRVANRLPIRVHGIVIADTRERLGMAATNLSGAGGRLRWLGVKRFADGSLGGHTAAMHDPFADVDTTGTFRLTPTDTDLARESLRLGGMVAIHAIGDRAVDGVLDVFDVLVSEGANGHDLRMEHASVLSPEQVDRFAKLGAIACVQPAFLASESTWLERRLGAERMPWAYPFRSLASAGVTLAGSSDCPVEPPHPLRGMAAAIDRHGINEDDRLTGGQALEMFTDGAAASLREPPPIGVGSPADFVVLDVDPLTASADAVHNATVLATYVDGVPVMFDPAHAAWVDD